MNLRHVCSFLAAGIFVFSFTGSTAKVDSQIHPIDRLGVDLRAHEIGSQNGSKRAVALAIPPSAYASEEPTPEQPPLPVLRSKPIAVHSGVKVIPPDVEADTKPIQAPPGVKVEASVGAFAIKLPATSLTRMTNNNRGTIAKQANRNRDVEGSKLEASINFHLISTTKGNVFLGVDGFHATANDIQTATCGGERGVIGCGWHPSFARDLTVTSANYGSTSSTTRQDVTYQRVAVKVGLEATPTVSVFAGGDLRRLKQTTALKSFSFEQPEIRFDYDESINTTYAGAFAGATGQADLGSGFFINGTAQLGLYRAKTKMTGENRASGMNFIANGARTASETTYIGSLKSEVGYAADGFTIAAFAELEGVGWAPKMEHREKGNSGAGSIHKATEIIDGDALNYTVGGRFNVKF